MEASEAVKTLRRFYDDIRDSEAYKDSLHKNLPLEITRHYEQYFRRVFLDEEDAAKEANEFLRGYAKRNNHIFHEDAKNAIECLGYENARGIYITELRVPPSKKGIAQHVVDIDLVSHRPINMSIGVLAYILTDKIGLTPFCLPEQKGSMDHRYWVSHSITKRHNGNKDEILHMKLRKRIHGTGYSSFTPEQLESIKKTTPHILNCFAE